MAKIKRGKYLPRTRELKVLQNELASVNTRLKTLIGKFQRIEGDSLALENLKMTEPVTKRDKG